MKIYIAADHRGIDTKYNIMNYLKANNYEVKEVGLDNNPLDDYTDFAFKLGNLVNKDSNYLGILICGNGIGMSIAANKVKGIRCARVVNSDDAFKARNHNGANVIAVGADLDDKTLLEAIKTFLETESVTNPKYLNRVNKIINYEEGKYNEL